MSETPFTETRRFKAMRATIGAMNPVIERILPSRFGRRMNRALLLAGRGPDMLRGFGVPVDDDGRIAEADKADADAQALVVAIQLEQPIDAPSA